MPILLSEDVKKFVFQKWARAALIAAFFALIISAQAALPGPEAVAKLRPIGRLEGSQRLKLAIGLASRDEQGLDTFVHDVYDPASTNYHRFLSPEQFAEKFGPTEQDYKTVIEYAKARGLNVTRQYSNRVVLDVEGSVSDIEKTLHVTLRTYQHPTEARTFYSPDVEPSLDLGVHVLHIGGLDNYTMPHPKHRHHPLDEISKATPQGSAPKGQLWGNDFRDAYVPGTTLTGAGQNLGLLEFEGYYPTDITDYENAIGMSASSRPQLVNVPLQGGATPQDGGDNGEECSLDIEMAVAMAPGLSKIYVFEDGDQGGGNAPFDDVFESMVSYPNILQFSCSWGGDTSRDPTSEVLFKQMAAQGQSFYNASGDTGAFVGPVEFPSDSPSITQVGGTTLTDGSAPSYPWESEVVWDSASGPNVSGEEAASSSGGISTYYTIPSWQSTLSMTANLGSTTMRNTPDVAANADNCYLYTDDGQPSGGWAGTSCAAPLWAAFTAMINQQAAAKGLPPVGFLNPSLYALAAGTSYSSLFHDITSGNNTWKSSPNRFYAVDGYDLCCGLGTMKGTNLIDALLSSTSLPAFEPRATGYTWTADQSCSSDAINPGETATVSFAFQNIGKASSTNLVATLLPYLLYRGESEPGVAASASDLESLLADNETAFPSPPQTDGVVAAGASVTNTFTFFADGTCGQTITALLQLQDGATDLGTISYSLQLGSPISTTNYAVTNASTPALPANWTTSASKGNLSDWTTENTNDSGSSFAFYCPDSPQPGEVYLYSPSILLAAGINQLSFLNDYNLKDSYDGGVLQIATGGGAFADIVTAGGSFVTNGYNGTLTDAGDSGSDNNPLTGLSAWTGTSGGFVQTIVNLPTNASGTNIQLRWVCGTDSGNSDLDTSTPSGWWIDDISISQPSFTCSDCSSNVTVPTILFPTNGFQLTTISPVIVVTGLAPASAPNAFVYANDGTLITNAPVDGNGVFAAVATLNFGTNTLWATQNGTNSTDVVVQILLGPPVLNVASVVNPQVSVSGIGASNATIYLYEGSSATGAPLTNFTANGSGYFSGTVTLPLGQFTLTATEAVGNQTSANTTPETISVVPTPPPKILSPLNGSIEEKTSVTVTGTGLPGASVTIYNVTNGGTSVVTGNVNHGGKFSVLVPLADGINSLYAIQRDDGTNSPASDTVEITDYLAPQILFQPINQTNFLKGSVTFSAEVVGAAPLRIFWLKNGKKIPGANGKNLTVSNLQTNDTTNTYSLVATNKYGPPADSAVVGIFLVSNPFTNLAGAYYGLFTNAPADFESSGLLALNLTSQGKFSARILNAGSSYSFSGGLSGVGWWSNIISRGSTQIPLTVVLNLDLTNDVFTNSAVSLGANWYSTLIANRAAYNRTAPFPDSGKFTLVFGNTNTNFQSPGGDGYAAVNITSAGMVTLNGVLPDNTSFASGTVGLSHSNQWPLYVPLNGKYGSLSGWINFTNDGFAGSNVMWFRTNADGKLYTNGFTNTLTVAGSAFSPDDNAALLNSPNLEVILSGGNLADTLSNTVTASANGKFTPSGGGILGLTLSLNPGSGVLKGSFTGPAATAPAPIKGILLQQQTNAAGFFINGTNSGTFLLTPE
jgi:hypothetical protein